MTHGHGHSMQHPSQQHANVHGHSQPHPHPTQHSQHSQHPQHAHSTHPTTHSQHHQVHGHTHTLSGVDPLETTLGPFPCVCVRGLTGVNPAHDVMLMFRDFAMIDVVVMPDTSFGQRQVQIPRDTFVLFANHADFEAALQTRPEQPIGGSRYLEFFQVKRADYYNAVASQFNPRVEMGEGVDMHAQWVGGSPPPQTQHGHRAQPQMMQKGMHHPSHTHGHGHMQHHGKPYSIGAHGHGDFRGQPGTAGSVGSGGPGSGSEPGLAASGSGSSGYKENSGRPRSERGQGGSGGGPSSGNERSGGGRTKGGRQGSGRGGGIQHGDHTGYLRMRGLPFTATKSDIASFFSEYDPVPDSIVLTYRSDGRATGEGYIAFHSPDTAKSAMVLHRNSMGSRYIELFISNKDEHGRAQAREMANR